MYDDNRVPGVERDYARSGAIAGASQLKTGMPSPNTLMNEVAALSPKIDALNECAYRLERIADSLFGPVPKDAANTSAQPAAPIVFANISLELERRHNDFGDAISRLQTQLNRIEGRVS